MTQESKITDANMMDTPDAKMMDAIDAKIMDTIDAQKISRRVTNTISLYMYTVCKLTNVLLLFICFK